jgi:hypothetical protein
MPLFGFLKNKDKGGKPASSTASAGPPKPTWTDAWMRTEVTLEEVRELMHALTIAVKNKGTCLSPNAMSTACTITAVRVLTLSTQVLISRFGSSPFALIIPSPSRTLQSTLYAAFRRRVSSARRAIRASPCNRIWNSLIYQ